MGVEEVEGLLNVRLLLLSELLAVLRAGRVARGSTGRGDVLRRQGLHLRAVELVAGLGLIRWNKRTMVSKAHKVVISGQRKASCSCLNWQSR